MRRLMAYPVTPGRCRHCGLKSKQVWTPKAMIQAVHTWVEKHGSPPCYKDWQRSSPTNPVGSVAYRMFGGWNKFIRAAGYEPRKHGWRSRERWTEELVIDAMLDWVLANGRWPTMHDWWYAEEGRPCMRTVLRIFGKWDAARRAAGYTGKQKAQLRRGALKEAA